MANTPLSAVLRHIHELAGSTADRERTDRHLLERFVVHRDEAAFTALVRRHGPLVQRVCRNVLHHDQDAEDALQATFLVLARKAAAIRKAEALASWLHGVAYRVAQTARRKAARRRAQEKLAMKKSAGDIPSQVMWRDVQAVVDEEIQRLPESQRAPFVLCFLEGRSRAEAAHELGWKEGTLSSRLARARLQLQKQLRRRGVTLTAVLGAAALTDRAGTAASLPVSLLVEAALRPATATTAAGIASSASALADAVIKAMFAGKRTIGAFLVLTMTIILAGAGVVAHGWPRAGLSARPPVNLAKLRAPAPPQPQLAPAARERGDGLGDPLPPGAVGRIGTIRLRHGGPVTCVAWAPKGKLLASGGCDNVVALWEVATGKERARLRGHQSGIEALAFSADGRLLASGGGGPNGKGGEPRMIRVWDIATRQEVAGFCNLGVTVRSLAFSRDGKKLASAFADRSVRVWEAATGKHLLHLPATGSTTGAVLAPDASHAAWGYPDKTVVIRELAQGKETLRRKNLPGGVTALAFAPNGKALAVSGTDQRICMWHPRTGKQTGRLTGRTQEIKTVAFLPDGKTLASWNESGLLDLWDLGTGKRVYTLCQRSTAVAFAPDGQLMAWTDRTAAVHLWNFRKDRPACRLAAHEAGLDSAVLTADGKALTTYSSGDRTVRRWDLASRKEIHKFALGKADQSFFFSITVSGNGKTVAAAGYTWSQPTGVRPALWLLDGLTGRRLHELHGHQALLRAVAFSPDGGTLASGGEDCSIFLWKVATGKRLHHLRGHKGRIGAVTFSPDGKVLASVGNGGSDQSLCLWETASGKLLHQIKRGYCDTSSVAFSPDGRTVTAASGEQAVGLWEVATGQQRLTFAKQRGWWVRCVAFSPDGNTLAVGVDNDVCLWNVLTGTEVNRYPGHRGAITSLAFRPDSKVLISGSEDTTALLWDVNADRRPVLVRPRDLLSGEFKSLWPDLAGADGAKAYQAMGRLITARDNAVPFLKANLRPIRPLDAAQAKQVAGWIGELDHSRFRVRQQASRALERVGEAVRPALMKALAGPLSEEARRRVAVLLAKWERTSCTRDRRALEVLERIGTAKARQIVAALARGESQAWLTQEAGEVLARLSKRSAASGENWRTRNESGAP
jgi:RNA polymerase sigma factor (sigma-70 family)